MTEVARIGESIRVFVRLGTFSQPLPQYASAGAKTASSEMLSPHLRHFRNSMYVLPLNSNRIANDYH